MRPRHMANRGGQRPERGLSQQSGPLTDLQQLVELDEIASELSVERCNTSGQSYGSCQDLWTVNTHSSSSRGQAAWSGHWDGAQAPAIRSCQEPITAAGMRWPIVEC